MAYQIKEEKNLNPNTLQSLFKHAPWAKDRAPEEIAQMLQHTHLVFSVWTEETLVGFARVLTDFTFRAMIYDVVIHPDHQRAGLGRLLLEKIIHHPKLIPIQVLSLFTRDKIDFYEKLGFQAASDHGLSGMLYIRPASSHYC